LPALFPRERPPGKDGNTHGGKIARCDRRILGQLKFSGIVRLPFEAKAAARPTAKRQERDRANGVYTGSCFEFSFELIVVHDTLCEVGELACGQTHAGGQRIGRHKSGVDRLELPQALGQESRPYQKHERHGHLHHGERPLQLLAGVCLATLTQVVHDVGPHDPERRRDPDDQPHHQGREDGEGEHPRVHRDFTAAREKTRCRGNEATRRGERH
jgi:hypothetical protein